MTQSIEASHILIMYEGSMRSSSTRSKEEAHKIINSLHEKIKNGNDFSQCAQQESDCPSGQQGGSLGVFQRGQMVPAFEQTAFALEINEMSDVIETDFGFHIIKRTA